MLLVLLLQADSGFVTVFSSSLSRLSIWKCVWLVLLLVIVASSVAVFRGSSRGQRPWRLSCRRLRLRLGQGGAADPAAAGTHLSCLAAVAFILAYLFVACCAEALRRVWYFDPLVGAAEYG